MTDELTEIAGTIHFPVGQEILASVHTMIKGEENGLYHVFHIHKGDVLLFETSRKVDMVLYGLCHHEVVALARPVYTRGSKNDIGKVVANRTNELLGKQFALSVNGVRLWVVMLIDFLIGGLFPDRTEDTKRTEINKLVDRHLQIDECLDQVDGPFCVHFIEIFLMQTFGKAGSMNNVVEAVRGKSLCKLCFR